MRWMLVAVGVVLLTTALSIVGAAHRGAALCEVAKMAEYGFVFAAVALAFANDPDERPFWIALCGTTAIVCLGALAQYLVGAHSEVVLGGRAIPRIAGPLEGPNQLAGYLEIVLPLLLARSVLGGGAIVIGRDGSGGRRCADAFTTGIRGRRDRRADRARPARSAQVCGARHARDRKHSASSAPWRWSGPVPLRDTTPSIRRPPRQRTSQIGCCSGARLSRCGSVRLVGIGAGNYELELADAGLPGIQTHANSLYLHSLAETGVLGLAATIGRFCRDADRPLSVALALGAGRRHLGGDGCARGTSDRRRSVLFHQGRLHVLAGRGSRRRELRGARAAHRLFSHGA